MSYVEFSWLSQLQRQVDLLESDELATDMNVGQLNRRLRALQETMLELSVGVSVLSQMLAERGGVDGAQLQERVTAAVAEMRKQTAGKLTCEACGRVVPARLTVITARGTVCDVCAASIP